MIFGRNPLLAIGLLILICSSGARLSAADFSVSVDLNGTIYQYQQPPRLAEVLQSVGVEQSWYWPAASLYRLDSEKPDQLREQLLQKLTTLQGKWQKNSAYVNSIEQIRLQLQLWQLAERIAIHIDYDLARLQQADNPQFEPGRYRLTLAKRPQSVSIIGLAQDAQINHSGNTPVRHYVEQIKLLKGASNDWLFILQPDGQVIKAGVASWNQQHIEAMPGAQLFVPFDIGLFGNELNIINQDLLELAKHRVLQ